MERQLKATGIFWGIVFLVATTINLYRNLSKPDVILIEALMKPNFIILLICTTLLFVSGFVNPLRWAQPIIMLGLTPLPFLTNHDSFYGLGFFVMGILLLFRLGFYENHRIPKFIISIVYLFICELGTALAVKRDLFFAMTPIFFMLVFLVFLYLAFQEKLAVYLKEPKPTLSLSAKGLSGAESIYIQQIVLGKNLKEMAGDFSVSESTIRNTLVRAYKKLGVDDKSAVYALAEKYIIVD